MKHKMISLIATILFAGCGEQQTEVSKSALGTPPAAKYFRYQAHYAVRSEGDLGDRIAKILDVMGVGSEGVTSGKIVLDDKRKFFGSLKDGVSVSYDGGFDDLKVSNERVFPSLYDEDIGVESARQIADKILYELAQRQVVRSDLLAKIPRVSTTTGGRGRGGNGMAPTVEAEGTLEYIFTYHRQFNGVPTLNAATRIFVARTGAVRMVRLAELDVESVTDGAAEVPGFGAPDLALVTSENDVRRLLTSTRPGAVPLSIELAYAFHEGVLDPQWVTDFTNVVETAEGVSTSRRKRLGYPIENVDAKPIDYTPTGNRPQSSDDR